MGAYHANSRRAEILNELNETRKKKEELEIEVRQLRQRMEGSIFTPAEEKEFQHFVNALSRSNKIYLKVIWSIGGEEKTKQIKEIDIFEASFLQILYDYIRRGYTVYDNKSLGKYLLNRLGEGGYPLLEGSEFKKEYEMSNGGLKNATVELQTYSLLGRKGDRFSDKIKFTDKMFRFKFWLELRDDFVPELKFEYIGQSKV